MAQEPEVAADLFTVTGMIQDAGIGPQFAFPTASRDETGSGKYQMGFATVYFDGSSPQFNGVLS